jgi:phosphatidylserine/phosphatidylglycerophosphate/cardiolipin synthase-like enzyme
MFIVNALIHQDPERKVRELLMLLISKRALGLDVRVIVEPSRQNRDIRLANEVAMAFLLRHGVHVRTYVGAKRSLHSKYVIVDEDLVVLGSHNWTHSAFTENREDSIALVSSAHNCELADEFLKAWVAR